MAERKTASGRELREPNLQNVPIRTALGARIRAAFALPPVLLEIDFSELELAVQRRLEEEEASKEEP